jgi:hypothetical protein
MPKADATGLAPKKSADNPPARSIRLRGRVLTSTLARHRSFFLRNALFVIPAEFKPFFW